MSFKEIGTLSNEEIKQQLERIRRSKRFARASRSFRFLKFLVDGEQEGKEFSEEEIGDKCSICPMIGCRFSMHGYVVGG